MSEQINRAATPWRGLAPARRLPAVQSQAVLWWQLISAMEDFSRHTGLGLSTTWGAVHRGDFETARTRFNQVVHDVYATQHGYRHCPLCGDPLPVFED